MGPPGHLAIALAAKPAAPKAPLWVLLVATEVLDLLSSAFLALGIERTAVGTTDLSRGVQVLSPASVPWSHGLLMSVVWSVVAGATVFFFYRDRRTSIVVGLLVPSHWVLDAVVHLPDLPFLFDDSPLVGLGLWGSGPGLIISSILEFGLLAGGIAVYWVTRGRAAATGTGVARRGEGQHDQPRSVQVGHASSVGPRIRNDRLWVLAAVVLGIVQSAWRLLGVVQS